MGWGRAVFVPMMPLVDQSPPGLPSFPNALFTRTPAPHDPSPLSRAHIAELRLCPCACISLHFSKFKVVISPL